ncbi:hypothetical protein H0H93_014518 [Arthromyces matolae]|nr:hypothetical protein H0H93_014518 [Arthromyces matolae]
MGSSKKNKQKKETISELQDAQTPIADDEDLMDDLFAQLDSRDHSAQTIDDSSEVQTEATNKRPRQDAKGRFLARQARKAAALEQSQPPPNAELESRLKKEADDEQRDISKICQEMSLQIHEVNPDGHCLYSAIADQLILLGMLSASKANYAVVRQTASTYMLSHQDDFLPFLEASAPEDLSADGVMTVQGYERYCATVRDTAEWGGEPEILALSRAYNVAIHVVQAGRPSIVTHEPGGSRGTENKRGVIRISYHRKMYGLGEHYNSLRPKNTLSHLSHKVAAMLS